MEDLKSREQRYEPNTAILRTKLTSEDGSILEIIDFAPHFEKRGRTFRPTSFVRQFKVLSGAP